MRATRFASRGWVNWLPPERLSEHALAEAILRRWTHRGTRSGWAPTSADGNVRPAPARRSYDAGDARSDVTAAGPAALVEAAVVATASALAETAPVDTRATPAPTLRGRRS